MFSIYMFNTPYVRLKKSFLNKYSEKRHPYKRVKCNHVFKVNQNYFENYRRSKSGPEKVAFLYDALINVNKIYHHNKPS